MRYSIIVPAWNEQALLPATLDNLRGVIGDIAGDAHDGELIVVDNNSTDRTAEVATAGGARVIFEPVNRIATARNAGARAASPGEALVFVDADTTINATLLRAALTALDTGVAVGGGSTIAPDRPVSRGARAGIAFWNRIGRAAKLAAGCFVFCRRDAFEAVGGFPETVYAGEEIFLSRALKRWGKRRGLSFLVLDVSPVTTSTRKLDWYGPLALARQASMVFIPGALSSKRMMSTWYDDAGRSAQREDADRTVEVSDEKR